jgi:hypothetical protein
MLYDSHRQFEQHIAEQKLRMRHYSEAKLSTVLSQPVLNWKNALFMVIILSIIMIIIS